MSALFSGKYRGQVTDTRDPLQLGRIRALVPDALGVVATGWALPAVPVALPKSKGSALPKPGAGVWIEFEQGNPDRPIWTGCFYGTAAEVPPALKNTP